MRSIGFDAHDDDPLSDIELTDSDYEWITRQILLSALKLSVAALKAGSGRHVSVLSALEGGYDLDAISRSSVLHVAALQKGFEGVWEEYEKLLIEAKQEQDGFGGDEVAALTAELSAMGVFDIIDIDPSGNEQEAKESQIST